MPTWQKNLRSGATSHVIQVLENHCRKQVASTLEMTTEAKSDPQWFTTADTTRSRIEWLRTLLPGLLSADLASLTTTLQDASARSKLESGMALVTAWVSKGNEASEEEVAEMFQAFEACEGLRIDLGSAKMMQEVIERFRNQK